MKGRHARLCGHVSVMVLLVGHLGLLVFACSHWSNWWSLAAWPVCLAAFLVPALCLNYNTEDAVLIDTPMEANAFQNCRELGWAAAGILGICAYLPPVLAWYNSGFALGGVLAVYTSITWLHWVYVLWIRIYVFT